MAEWKCLTKRRWCTADNMCKECSEADDRREAEKKALIAELEEKMPALRHWLTEHGLAIVWATGDVAMGERTNDR
jgi:hypothetical protein